MAHSVPGSIKKFIKSPKRVLAATFSLGASEVGRASVREGKRALSPNIPKPKAIGAPPGRDDPAVAAARERLRLSEKRRKGRRAAILTGTSGVAQSTDLGGGIKRINALGSTAGQ